MACKPNVILCLKVTFIFTFLGSLIVVFFFFAHGPIAYRFSLRSYLGYLFFGKSYPFGIDTVRIF